MDEKIAIRVLLRHYFKKGLSAHAAINEICAVEGEDIVSYSTAKRWFVRFKNGDTSLQDEPRSGRPSMVDSEALRQAVEATPSTSTRRLSSELGISQPTVFRHLHELGMVNRSCRVVPHEMTPAQAQKRVKICKDLLNHTVNDRFIRRVVTCDEKWIFFRNPDMRNQWLNPGTLPEPVARRGRFEHKVMLCVWWNFEGPVHFEFVPEGKGITAELYSQQLGRMYEALTRKYPALVNRKQVLLQQDNAPPHVARSTQRKIQELEGIEILPHPPYSPDLAPSDYHLFRSMAHFLRGRTFNNSSEVEVAVTEFFASKPKEWYRAGIQNLAERWQKTIEYDGLYFEC